MTQIDWKVESQRFDGVAELYDIYRPSYPSALIEDIVYHTGIQPDDTILEIGGGTGKATLLFAQRGYKILCLEPGQNLLAVARENLKSFPRVTFVNARFEAWEAGEEKFGLVTSAQAFHWVPQEVRYKKTAGVLRQDGHLAVFWNMYPRVAGKIGEELDEVYGRLVPELGKTETTFNKLFANRARTLYESPYFEKVVVRKYPWSERYDTKSYLGLLSTYSDHLRLAEQRRHILFAEIAEVIERHGGYIGKPYLAVVYMAQKSPV